DRQAHAEALGIDQVGLRWQADEVHPMAAEQELGRQQRPVGRAHDQDVVSCWHSEAPPCCNGRRGKFRPALLGWAMLFATPALCNPHSPDGSDIRPTMAAQEYGNLAIAILLL